MATIEKRITASADDCYIWGTTDITLTGTTQLLGHDGTNDIDAGFRFLDITIPDGATIAVAHVVFTAKDARTNDTVRIGIWGENSATPATFSTHANYDARVVTTEKVDWDFTTDWVQDSTYNSAELKTIIQELVDDYSGLSGYNLVLLLKDDSSDSGAQRRGRSWDDDTAKAPLLYIEYELAPTAETLAASNIGGTIARVNGKITDDRGDTCEARFRWGQIVDEVFVETVLHTGEYDHCRYRGTVVAPNGTLIAAINVFESDGGVVDITTGQTYKNLSDDKGETWGSESLLQDKGVDWGVVNSNFLKTSSNKIFFFYNRYKGYRDPCDAKIYYKVSTDNGATWGDETYINTGHNYSLTVQDGIELQNGTLIMPFSWGTDSGDAYWKSSVLISDDDGDSWEVGGTIDFSSPTGTGCDEPTVVEKSNGDLYALVRTTQGHLYYSTSDDDGATWSAAAVTSLVSGDINACLRRVSFSPNRILVSWDNHATNRYPLVMAYSTDDCATWSTPVTVTNPSYNSCMPYITVIDGNRAIITWWDNPAAGTDNSKAAIFFVLSLLWTETEWQNTLETDDEYYEDLTELDENTEYEYQTQAKNSAGEGDWTASAYFTTLLIISIICNLSVAPSLARTRDIDRGTSPSLTLSPSITRVRGLLRPTSSSLSLKATVSRFLPSITRTISANLSLTTALSKTVDWVRTSVSNLSLTTSISRSIARLRATVSSLSLTAVVVSKGLAQHLITIVANLSVSPTVAKTIAVARDVTTNLTLVASVSKSYAILLATSCSLAVSTTVGKIAAYVRTSTSNLSLTTTISNAVTWTRSTTSNIDLELSVLVTEIGGYLIQITANLSVAASVARSCAREITTSPSLSLTASISRIFTYAKVVSSNLSLTTSVSRLIGWVRAPTSNLTLTTTISRLFNSSRAVSVIVDLACSLGINIRLAYIAVSAFKLHSRDFIFKLYDRALTVLTRTRRD